MVPYCFSFEKESSFEKEEDITDGKAKSSNDESPDKEEKFMYHQDSMKKYQEVLINKKEGQVRKMSRVREGDEERT